MRFNKIISLIVGVNSNPSPGGNGDGLPPHIDDGNGGVDEDLIKQNNELYDKITKRLRANKKALLKEVLDYCNENGLEILDTINDPLHNTRIYEGFTKGDVVARMSVYDPENGMIYNFQDKVLGGSQNIFSKDNIKSSLDRTRSTLAEIQKDVNPEYYMNVRQINFVGDAPRALGYYYPGVSGFYLTPKAFDNRVQQSTGLKGTMIHEMAHQYEYEFYGGTGKLKIFSDAVPTEYARGDYSRYPLPQESISTTIEQVYTKTLREDAIMKNGRRVNYEFEDTYGRKGTSEELYDYWANEWKPQVKKAEEILKI